MALRFSASKPLILQWLIIGISMEDDHEAPNDATTNKILAKLDVNDTSLEVSSGHHRDIGDQSTKIILDFASHLI